MNLCAACGVELPDGDASCTHHAGDDDDGWMVRSSRRRLSRSAIFCSSRVRTWTQGPGFAHRKALPLDRLLRQASSRCR